MDVSEFVWSPDRIEHVARHGIEPDEFEQVCFGEALVLGAKAEGNSARYDAQ